MKTEIKFNKTMEAKPFMKIAEVSNYTGLSRNSKVLSQSSGWVSRLLLPGH